MAASILLPAARVKTTIDEIAFDQIENDSYTEEVEVTEHPVEEGADRTDHLREKPRELSFDGIISDVTDTGLDLDRVRVLKDALRKVRREGKLVTVVTPLETYSSMQVRRVTFSRPADVGLGLKVSVQLKEATTVTLQRVNLRPKANKNTGKRATEPANKAQADKAKAATKKSLLTKGIDAAASLVNALGG